MAPPIATLISKGIRTRRAVLGGAVLALLAAVPAVADAATSTPAPTGGTSPTSASLPKTTALRSVLGTVHLHVGMSGTTVIVLQRRLRSFGFALAVDGQFGRGTAAALRSFQRAHGLPVTGVVDVRTASLLAAQPASTAPATSTPVSTTPVSLTPAQSSVRAKIVTIARSQLGVAETPLGSNCTIYGPCEEWCADFATWVWRHAGVSNIGRIAYVPNLVAWAQNHGRWKDGPDANPQPGDIADFSGIHVGIVERVYPNGQITIIAGNTGVMAVARRGPGDPADGSTMGPGPVTGYISVTAVGTIARSSVYHPLVHATPEMIARMDPQDHTAAAAARDRAKLGG